MDMLIKHKLKTSFKNSTENDNNYCHNQSNRAKLFMHK